MSVVISGSNIVVDGQITVAGQPTSAQHVVRKSDISAFRVFLLALNLNAPAPVDLTAIAVTSAKYIPRRILICNPTGNMSVAELAIYTAAGGAGTQVVAPIVLSALTAAGKFMVLTISALTDPLTAALLYPRLSIASGVAGTADLMMEYDDISDL